MTATTIRDYEASAQAAINGLLVELHAARKTRAARANEAARLRVQAAKFNAFKSAELICQAALWDSKAADADRRIAEIENQMPAAISYRRHVAEHFARDSALDGRRSQAGLVSERQRAQRIEAQREWEDTQRLEIAAGSVVTGLELRMSVVPRGKSLERDELKAQLDVAQSARDALVAQLVTIEKRLQ